LLFYLTLRLGLLAAMILPPQLMINITARLIQWGLLLSPRRRVVAGNLASFEAAGAQRRRPGDVFLAYGRYWGELLALAARPGLLGTWPIRVEGEEHLTAVAGGPICVLSAHLGNWDLLAWWLNKHLDRFTVVVEELKPPVLFRFFLGLRHRGGNRVLVSDGQGLKLYRHLKGGGAVGLVADRLFGQGSDGGGGSRTATIAGGERGFPAAGMDLARRAGAALIPIFLVREAAGYVIKIGESLDLDEDPVAAYARVLESEILRHPEQWVVLYPLHDA
jgi:lauroyl/myristoyl acyltransferase